MPVVQRSRTEYTMHELYTPGTALLVGIHAYILVRWRRSCWADEAGARSTTLWMHILQPPNYLIIVVNRFRYINNQFAKDKCSIPMDMTVVLGYHKFSLQATIDHHGPSIYSGHYTTSVNCCNRTFYCNDNTITEFDMINTKNSSTAYVVIYKLIT